MGSPGAPDINFADPQARNRCFDGVSIIVPTYKEAENIPHLVKRIETATAALGLPVEVLLLDDNSRDGTEEAVARIGRPWVRLIVRTAARGLSPAVLDGLRAAQYEVLVVMDADLSHPPETIGEFVNQLAGEQCDFVLGSRYVAGGSTDAAWGVFRWLNSKVATVLARPLTNIKDPMSGFFALRRATFVQADQLNPVGYKIGLELLVKCRCKKVVEVPIHFTERRLGQSKLSVAEQLRYLQHLRRLYTYLLLRRRG